MREPKGIAYEWGSLAQEAIGDTAKLIGKEKTKAAQVAQAGGAIIADTVAELKGVKMTAAPTMLQRQAATQATGAVSPPVVYSAALASPTVAVTSAGKATTVPPGGGPSPLVLAGVAVSVLVLVLLAR